MLLAKDALCVAACEWERRRLATSATMPALPAEKLGQVVQPAAAAAGDVEGRLCRSYKSHGHMEQLQQHAKDYVLRQVRQLTKACGALDDA